MTSIILDIEANGLKLEDVTKIWCICFKFLEQDQIITLSIDQEYPKVPSNLGCYMRDYEIKEIIGHNIIAYDIPVMQKILDLVNFTGVKLIDTLVISRRLDPDRDMKRHSLEDWGRRLGGEQKVQHNDWGKFDKNMLTRCASDVRLTEKVFKELQKEIKRNESRN